MEGGGERAGRRENAREGGETRDVRAERRDADGVGSGAPRPRPDAVGSGAHLFSAAISPVLVMSIAACRHLASCPGYTVQL